MHIPVSSPSNLFFDSEQIDNDNLTLEQNHNTQIQSSIINNHFGTGVLPNSLGQAILFDTNNKKTIGLLDGKALTVDLQPSDSTLGNQLELELINSDVFGKRTIKVFIVGLDFNKNLQYDTFTFYRNEIQLTAKHYTQILIVYINDFIGDSNQSFNLGKNARLTIKETNSLSISRDCINVSQDAQPNIFFRDFYSYPVNNILTSLQNALPTYNINSLNITTSSLTTQSLFENDVVSQIGEKFTSNSNNIQKITLLLAVENTSNPNDLQWTGDLIVNLYKLQSSVSCSTDIVPNLAIQYDPFNIPLSQLTLNYNSLLNTGIVLNTVPQPVDFIFSNTTVGSGSLILPNNIYAITVKRAGTADKCQIDFAVGANSDTNNQRLTIFNTNIWVDTPEQSLWFRVYSDRIKASDGQAYDSGHGIIVPKTDINSDGINVDYSLNNIDFLRNDLYYSVLSANTTDSDLVIDQRTGNEVYSQQQFTPSISLLNTVSLNELKVNSDPLIIGTVQDGNVKSFDATNSIITAKLHSFSTIKNEILIKVIDDPLDARFDPNILNLVSELVIGNLSNALIYPNYNNNTANCTYRIGKAELITTIYGDINGDGIIDDNDLQLIQSLIGSDLNSSPSSNEYLALTEPFANDSQLSYQIFNFTTSSVVASGTDGYMLVNSFDPTQATFNSVSANFSSIPNLGNCKIIISNSLNNPQNDGIFSIVGLIDNNDIAIKKILYTSDTILQIFRGDINADMEINSSDISLISNYVNKVLPFPNTSYPANKIGTSFNVIKLSLEPFYDRNDDYPSVDSTRNTEIHIVQDIFENDSTAFSNRNFSTNPLQFNIIKQLSWREDLVVSDSSTRLVFASYSESSGGLPVKCQTDGYTKEIYPFSSAFDPGKNNSFVPNDLIMNFGGELTRPDGYYYKVDMEMLSIILEVPAVPFTEDKVINIFTDFVANFNGAGLTRLGFQSAKWSDCSFVGLDALSKNQCRFSISLQSLSPELSGTTIDGNSGIIVDSRMGIFIDPSTGLLSLNFNNLYEDPVIPTANTKIQITVFLKKAGWNNKSIFVSSEKIQNILGL